MHKKPFASALVLSGLVFSTVLGGVNFDLEFEPGSSWFHPVYGQSARNQLQGILNELGGHLQHDASVTVEVTDNNTTAFASATGFSSPIFIDGRRYRASVPWRKIVEDVDPNGGDFDALINWNFDLSLYNSGGTLTDDEAWQRLIGNVRGLGRHEIMHTLGMSSSVWHSVNGSARGEVVDATVYDRLLKDFNGNPVLGAYSTAAQRHMVSNFVLDPNWETTFDSSGITFDGIDGSGGQTPMRIASFTGTTPFIDFSHVSEVSYVFARPGEWGEINDADLQMLRGLGYSAPVTDTLDPEVRYDSADGFAIGIRNLSVNGVRYNVTFEPGRYNEVYEENAPVFLNSPSPASLAADRIIAILNEEPAVPEIAVGDSELLWIPTEITQTTFVAFQLGHNTDSDPWRRFPNFSGSRDVDFSGPPNSWLFAKFNLVCDLDSDGDCDVSDIDEMHLLGSLQAGVAVNDNIEHFDLNGDGVVNLSDRNIWLSEAAAANGLASPYRLGDGNLDGVVDVSDFNLWNENKFSVRQRWSQGNYSSDTVVDVSDFNEWNERKFTSSDQVLVPEPDSFVVMMLGLLCSLRLRIKLFELEARK